MPIYTIFVIAKNIFGKAALRPGSRWGFGLLGLLLLGLTFSSTGPVTAATPAAATVKSLELLGHLGGRAGTLQVYEDRLYASFGPELAILDLTNPMAPQRSGYIVRPRLIDTFAVSGSFVYGSSGNQLWLVNVADPTRPVQLDLVFELPAAKGSITDIIPLGNNYVYLTTEWGGVVILDQSNPAASEPVELPDLNGQAKHLHFSDGHLCLNDQELDLATPTQPQVKGPCPLPAQSEIARYGQYGYSLADSGDIRVLDLSSREIAPTVGHYQSWLESHLLAPVGAAANDLYLVAEAGRQLVLDVSDPAQPHLSATYQDTRSELVAAAAHGHQIYQAAGRRGVHRLDLSSGRLDREVAPPYNRWHKFTALDVTMADGLAYLAGGQAGLEIRDAATGNRLDSQEAPEFWAFRVAVLGSFAYVAGYNSKPQAEPATPQFELAVFNVAAPTAMREIKRFNLPNLVWAMAASGQYLYLADERGRFQILDVANPARPVTLASHYLDDKIYRIGLSATPQATYAYLAAGREGLRVLDVTDPARPVEIAAYATPTEVYDVALAGDKIYLADRLGGLYILRLIDTPPPDPATAEPPRPILEPSLPAPSPISPYELAAQIKANPQAALHPLAAQIGVEVGIGDQPHVDLNEVNLQAKGGPDVVLKIIPSWRFHYRFYARQAQGWVFLGYVNSFDKYGSFGPDSYRFVTDGDKGVWFVVETSTGGTGVSEYKEVWYWLGDQGPKQVLAYGQHGGLGWSPDAPYSKEFQGEAKINDQDGFTVEVRYQIDYTENLDLIPDENKLFSYSPTMRYIWQPDRQEFVFDPAQSEMSPQQLNSLTEVMSFDLPEPQDFITYNFERLLHLALSGSEWQRRWLDQFLEEYEGVLTDTLEKRILGQSMFASPN